MPDIDLIDDAVAIGAPATGSGSGSGSGAIVAPREEHAAPAARWFMPGRCQIDGELEQVPRPRPRPRSPFFLFSPVLLRLLPLFSLSDANGVTC